MLLFIESMRELSYDRNLGIRDAGDNNFDFENASQYFDNVDEYNSQTLAMDSTSPLNRPCSNFLFLAVGVLF